MQSCCIWATGLPVFSPCFPNCVLLQYCLDGHKEKKGHLQELYLCFICPTCGDLKHFPRWRETCPPGEDESKPNTESGVVPSGLLLIRLGLFEVETGFPPWPSSPPTPLGCFHGQGGMFKSSFKMWCRVDLSPHPEWRAAVMGICSPCPQSPFSRESQESFLGTQLNCSV